MPYLHLLSNPTWHSRTTSWSLSMKVPQSILQAGHRTRTSDVHSMKNVVRTQFQTKVVVNDDRISVEGEGAPNVVGLFKGSSEDICSMNSYGCSLPDLPVVLLQQVCLCLFDTLMVDFKFSFLLYNLLKSEVVVQPLSDLSSNLVIP